MVNAMAMKLYNDVDIQDIADAIRSVNGESTTYKVSEMAAVIRTLTYIAPSMGNLRDVFGYTDGKRVGTSDGGYRTAVGYTVVEYIPLADFVDSNNQVVIRTRGVNFNSASHSNCAYAAYNNSKTFSVASYLSSGSHTHGIVTVTVTHTGDSDNTTTITISGLTSALLSGGGWNYLRLCGYGSGANLDIRINEDFD